MDYNDIDLEIKEGIAFVSLNSPESLNAMTEGSLLELQAVLDCCARDKAVRVVLLRGEGRAFSAGGDIRSMQRGIDEGDRDMLARIVHAAGGVARRLRNIPVPVVAAVHGAAAGAGCSMALLCDFRVVTEDVRFIEAFIHLGLVPDMGGTFILSRYLGLGRLTELLMLGKSVSAGEAWELGLVNAVVPADRLAGEATELAERLRALPGEALAFTKKLVNQALFPEFDTAVEEETELQAALFRTADYREGVAAFLEKRPPVFGNK